MFGYANREKLQNCREEKEERIKIWKERGGDERGGQGRVWD